MLTQFSAKCSRECNLDFINLEQQTPVISGSFCSLGTHNELQELESRIATRSYCPFGI